jgi:hypothetical protein
MLDSGLGLHLLRPLCGSDRTRHKQTNKLLSHFTQLRSVLAAAWASVSSSQPGCDREGAEFESSGGVVVTMMGVIRVSQSDSESVSVWLASAAAAAPPPPHVNDNVERQSRNKNSKLCSGREVSVSVCHTHALLTLPSLTRYCCLPLYSF